MTATDACLMRLGFSGGGLGPECGPSGLPFNTGRRGRAMFGAEREVDGLVRPEGTASREWVDWWVGEVWMRSKESSVGDRRLLFERRCSGRCALVGNPLDVGNRYSPGDGKMCAFVSAALLFDLFLWMGIRKES